MSDVIILKRVFKGWPITQQYGKTKFAKEHPTYYSNCIHKGVDFGVSQGMPIRAAHDGVVIRDDDNGKSGVGIYVTIWDMEQNIATRYYHMLKNIMSVGDIVKAGDIIGQVGSTGLSTGSHLHFEIVRVDERGYVVGRHSHWRGTVDPMDRNLVKMLEGNLYDNRER